ncbi:hypothetical protein BGZ49_002107 [Haplosporangium sp. Z 27]|nr:hypothetical protein BGZ49_002107 [Haplosporangium sp. Z 27]
MSKSAIITLREDATSDQLDKVIKDVEKQGGEITHKYTLIRGFAVTIPDGHDSILDSLSQDENVDKIELDG